MWEEEGRGQKDGEAAVGVIAASTIVDVAVVVAVTFAVVTFTFEFSCFMIFTSSLPIAATINSSKYPTSSPAAGHGLLQIDGRPTGGVIKDTGETEGEEEDEDTQSSDAPAIGIVEVEVKVKVDVKREPEANGDSSVVLSNKPLSDSSDDAESSDVANSSLMALIPLLNLILVQKGCLLKGCLLKVFELSPESLGRSNPYLLA